MKPPNPCRLATDQSPWKRKHSSCFTCRFIKTTVTSLIQQARNSRLRPSSQPLSFLKPSSTRTKMTVLLSAWNSSASRNALTLSSKASFVIRFACARTSVVPTEQSANLLHATPNAALTMATMSNAGTSIANMIAIAPTMKNVK